MLSSLSVLRRQRLHLAVADAIERIDRRARSDRPSEIADHLLQAGSAADRERTLEYLELSAARAFEAAAFEEALRAVDDAIVTVDPDDSLRVARLHEWRGRAVRALGRFEQCIQIWDGVIDRYAQNGLREEAADLAAEVGYQLVWLNQFEDAFAAYARGLAIVGDEPTPTRARLLGFIGGITGLAGLYEPGVENIGKAEAIARKLGDDRTLGEVLWNRTMARATGSSSIWPRAPRPVGWASTPGRSATGMAGWAPSSPRRCCFANSARRRSSSSPPWSRCGSGGKAAHRSRGLQDGRFGGAG